MRNLFMRNLSKIAFLPNVLFLMSTMFCSTVSAQDKASFELTGCWLFKKAEYAEQITPNKEYKLKYTIDKEENLSTLGACYQDVVGRACFYNRAVAKFSGIYTTYIGSFEFPFDNSLTAPGRYLMIFGNVETIGKASPVEGLVFNAPQIEYRIEILDNNTLCIVIERPCIENGATIQGLVRSTLIREEKTDNN